MRAASILLPLLLTATPAMAGLFGSTDIRRTDSQMAFAKWNDMLDRAPDELGPMGPAAGSGGCVPNPRFPCARAPEAVALVRSLRGMDRLSLLRSVNAGMNQHLYITDPQNYGLDDYWGTLPQFERRDGDCEDYAIAKYMILKQLGVPVADMRIAIVMDLNLNVPHAILAVKSGDTTYILDNQITEVLPDTAIRHYRPHYSINEQNWWLHQVR